MEKVLCIEDLERKLEQFQIILTNSDNVKKDILELTEQMVEMVANYKKTQIDFQLICNHLNTTLFVTDDRGYVCYVNPSYEERTGLKKEYILGKTIFELQKENVIQCDVIPRMLKEEKPINAIGYVVSTDYRGFVAGIPVKDENGKLRYAITTDWDVMSIMEMENRLKQLQKGEIPDSTDEAGSVSVHTADEEEILYTSDVMRDLISLAKTVAQTDVSVLITGETGTGKELLSKVIVKYSCRADNTYIKVNCAAIPQDLLESELFGYEEGAFTGAKRGGKKGAFEQADWGTILLDEIGELPFQVQAKLLRVLQENEVNRVGGQQAIKLNVRVIAATNRNLLQEIRNGNFREDLYYRLNILPLELPPLRDRSEDIPFLVGRFLEEFDEKYKKITLIEADAMQLLRHYDWPGNIRELRNMMERLVILGKDGRITCSEIQKVLGVTGICVSTDQKEKYTLKEAVEQFEKQMIQNAILKEGNKKKASEALGCERTTFLKKCKRYEIE